ncbi:probable splicing factor, arginine/serine-rich 6 isoform X1 [Limulus polyphemus]|nr:probable splicing factor, arginine/serine-rich 6 isoform X1 [Limulus polyphemus]
MSGRSQLFVGRLPLDVRERDIERIFEKYGKLLRCDVKYGTGMAYAFVDYDDRRDAEDAIRYENGREMRGQSMVVEWARGPSYRSSTYSVKSGGGLSRSAYEECYHCRRSGHWARDCPKLERDRYYPRRNRSRSRSRRGKSYSRSRSRSKERRSYRKRSRSCSRSRGNSKKNHSRTRSRSLSGSRSHSREHEDEKQRSNKDDGHSRSRSPSKSRSPSPESMKCKSRSPSEENVHEEKGNEDDKEWDNCSRSRSHSVSRSPDKSPTIHNHKDQNDDGDAGSEQNDRQESTP